MFHRPTHRKKPTDPRKNRRLALECLETRELLSVSPLPGLLSYGDIATPDWFETVREIEAPVGDLSQVELGDAWDGQWILQLNQDAPAAARSVHDVSQRLSGKGVTVLSGLGAPGLVLARVEAETPWEQSEILAGLDGLEYWQPNYFVTAAGVAQEVNDPQVDLQWALDTIDVSAAWSHSTGTGVVVAVLDSGIALTHPDLKSNLWINTAEISGDGLDNDGNGFIDDVNGWNFVTGTANVTDNDGHGTHVSGIIGATANNGLGGVGAAPGVRILPLKVINGSTGSTASLVSAMNYLLDLKSGGVNIVAANMSLGYYSEDSAVRQAVARADAAGVIVVASAGNNGKNNDHTLHYPSQYTTALDNVISVASIDKNGLLAGNSNYGVNSVDLAAPGVSIYSTTKNGSYGYMSGTSMAAPMVTAAVALLAAAEPDLAPGEIKAKILEATVPLTSLTGKVATGGRLDLAGLFSPTEESTPAAPSELSIVAISGDQVTLQWRDNSLNEDSFEIQTSADAGKTWTAIATNIPANQQTRTVTFDPAAVSLYRVRAVNEIGASPWSDFVSTLTTPLKKPTAPTGVRATATDDREIVVTWKAVSGATAYRVERAPAANGPWQEVYFGTGLSLTDSCLTSSTRYYYRAYAVNISVFSPASSTVSATTAAVLPDTPTGLTASLVDARTVALSWNAVLHATSYRIETYDAAKDRWLTAGTSASDAFSHRGLLASTTYRYRVVAISKAGESSASQTVAITTPMAVPVKPPGLKGSVLDATTVRLDWNAVAGAASYRIEHSMTGKANAWTTFQSGVTGTTFTATELSAGMKHYFRIVAVNASGDSPPSTVYSPTTPALAPEGTPASVTAAAESGSQVRVFWTAVKNATKYVVERSTDGTKWTKVKTVSATETEVLLSGHKPTTEYFYRVTATSKVASSNPSEAVKVTTRFPSPAAPRLTLLGTDGVRIAWNAVKGADGYRVERAVEGSILWDVVIDTPSDTLSFDDDTCEVDTVYCYRIVAVSEQANVDSVPSKAKSIRTAPVAPEGARIVEVSAKQVVLGWDETSGALRYTVQRYNGKVWQTIGTTKTNEFTAKSLKVETDYLFRVVAVGKDGSSEPGEEISVSTLVDVPATPGGLKVYATDSDTVVLTWKAVAEADSYRVFRYDSAAKSWTVVAESVRETVYYDTNLSASTRYQYRIYAVNATGPSRRYASGNTVTLKASGDAAVPSAVTLLSASKNTIKIGFAITEGGGQTYRIQWSTDGVLWNSQKTFTSAQGTVAVSGLKSETTYYFRIRLEKNKIISEWSDVVQFSTV